VILRCVVSAFCTLARTRESKRAQPRKLLLAVILVWLVGCRSRRSELRPEPSMSPELRDADQREAAVDATSDEGPNDQISGAVVLVAHEEIVIESTDSHDVYWHDARSSATHDVFATPIDGGPTKTIASRLEANWMHDSEGFHQHVNNGYGETLQTMGPSGKVIERLDSKKYVGDVLHDGHALYWFMHEHVGSGCPATSRLMKFPLSGGPPTTLLSGQPCFGFTSLVHDTLYFSLDYGNWTLDPLYSVSTSGGAVRSVRAVPPINAANIYITKRWITWTVESSPHSTQLYRISTSGGPTTLLATIGTPAALRGDDSGAYWTSEDRQIWRLPEGSSLPIRGGTVQGLDVWALWVTADAVLVVTESKPQKLIRLPKSFPAAPPR
jgi:hypothetical protein